jgi:hypothetical protein
LNQSQPKKENRFDQVPDEDKWAKNAQQEVYTATFPPSVFAAIQPELLADDLF